MRSATGIYREGRQYEVDAQTVLTDALDIDPSNTYTPTNDVTDRAYDANSTTTAEMADVLATLIKDLGLDA